MINFYFFTVGACIASFFRARHWPLSRKLHHLSEKPLRSLPTDLKTSGPDSHSLTSTFSIPLSLLPESSSLLVCPFWRLEWPPFFAMLSGLSSHSSSPASAWQLCFGYLWFALHGVPSPSLANTPHSLPTLHRSYPLNGSLSLLRNSILSLLHWHWSRGLSLTGYFFFDPLSYPSPPSHARGFPHWSPGLSL